ncbi:hypothetical protein [Vibrio rotiferianus]|uniref:hypothetical protein n=1 Tax=Vibrio rotiferianus TaxID=190895 RepID=UPI0005F01A6A|nr:hypothetical protein [Vibrio rotiferianus]
MNRSALFISLICLALVGCDSHDGNRITAHEAYSNILKSGAFPSPVGEHLKEILDESSHFGMTEYQELDLAIQTYCTGTEMTWRDRLSLLPMKFISVVVPGWNSLAVFSSPELMIVRQVDAANSCEFNPLTKYMED